MFATIRAIRSLRADYLQPKQEATGAGRARAGARPAAALTVGVRAAGSRRRDQSTCASSAPSSAS